MNQPNMVHGNLSMLEGVDVHSNITQVTVAFLHISNFPYILVLARYFYRGNVCSTIGS